MAVVATSTVTYVERKSRAQRVLRQKLQGRDDLNHRQLGLLDHALTHSDALYRHESHGNSHRVPIMTARSDLLEWVNRGWLQRSKSGKRKVYQPVPEREKLMFPAG